MTKKTTVQLMDHRGHLMDEADQALSHHLIRLAFPRGVPFEIHGRSTK
jgi:hypothetical protein